MAAREAIESLIRTIDRRHAHGEAQVAVLEAALHLMLVDELPPACSPADRTELLRTALAAGRAAVLATNYALVASRSREPGRVEPNGPGRVPV